MHCHRNAELIGRPVGSPAFLEAVACKLGRTVAPGKRGRKPPSAAEGAIKKGNTGVSP
jgi:hypothetical protein